MCGYAGGMNENHAVFGAVGAKVEALAPEQIVDVVADGAIIEAGIVMKLIAASVCLRCDVVPNANAGSRDPR
jgi:hypothetical protein